MPTKRTLQLITTETKKKLPIIFHANCNFKTITESNRYHIALTIFQKKKSIFFFKYSIEN